MSWLYVPGLVASNSDCELPSLRLASSATWRGKPSLPASWSRRWKTARWLQRLSGLTCSDSTLSLGVESWTASLRESRASRTPSQGSAAGMMTSAHYGPSSAESWKSVDPPWSSSKTSLLLFSTSNQSEIDYQYWATGLRLEYSARMRSGRRTDANDSLLWPTAVTEEHRNSRTTSTKAGRSLDHESREWPTPEALNEIGYQVSGGKIWPRLGTAAMDWQTPKATDGEKGGPNMRDGAGNPYLPSQATNWQTPATDSFRSRGGDRKDEMGLDQQTRDWATPTSRDWKDGACQNADVPENSLLGRQVLKGTGAESRKSLNPRFVEWLMGWPLGWTAFERVEMASYLLRQRRLLSRWLEGYSNES